jgi:hypothetical protein
MFDIFKNCHGRSQVNPSQSPFKRNRYYQGRMLTADDFQDEQDYFTKKSRRHNRYAHGSGVVEGLCLSLEGKIIRVNPGFALDCMGNEIEVQENVEIPLPKDVQSYYIVIQYRESETDYVPDPGAPVEIEGGNNQPSKILEGFEIYFETVNPTHRHQRRKCGLLPCGEGHGIPLGLLKTRGDRWWISRWFRRLRVR